MDTSKMSKTQLIEVIQSPIANKKMTDCEIINYIDLCCVIG
jgi:hypothetical protein